MNRSTLITRAALLLGLAACGGGQEHPSGDANSTDGATTTLAIVANEPVDGTTDVPINGPIRAAFSDAIDPTTLTVSSFSLTAGAVPVEGSVSFDGPSSTAVFLPTANLAGDTTFTATITTDVRSLSGATLPAPHTWTFTTGTTALGVPVNLRTAGNYAVLSRRAISGSGSMVTGDMGISPSLANSISGFALSTPPTEFSTSAQVTGKVYARDYLAPTPATLFTAIGDLQLAINEAAQRTPTVTAVGGEIGGMTLAPGIYHWQRVAITTDVTLRGSATDVWVFQVAETLGMAASMRVVLDGGALAKNVFWQVTGAMTIGANAQFNGVVLTSGAFTSGTASVMTGRVLAQMEITITNSTVVQASP